MIRPVRLVFTTKPTDASGIERSVFRIAGFASVRQMRTGSGSGGSGTNEMKPLVVPTA
jgi:hypothetical protein